MDVKRLKEILVDRIQIIALLLFALSLFLADVSLNNIMAYGNDIESTVMGSTKVHATSAFWFGFISMLFFFFVVAFRSVYARKHKIGFFDGLFGIIGIIGLMITLSGGLISFYHQNNLEIPFFSYTLTRINYYHTGVALDIISLFYFALTKVDARDSEKRSYKKKETVSDEGK